MASLITGFSIFFMGQYSIISCCPTNTQGFTENKELEITSVIVVRREESYQVKLKEVFSMPYKNGGFCIEREYIALINAAAQQYNKACPLEFLVKMVRMRVEKVSCPLNHTVITTNKNPPEMLVERLKTLLVEADLDESVTAGIWKMEHTCWKQNNRSLRACGISLHLRTELMEHPMNAMNLHPWIMESVKSLEGKLTQMHFHFNPVFWLPMLQDLTTECCLIGIHIMGTGWGNMTIQNQPRLKSLYLRHIYKDAIKVNYSSLPELSTLSLPDTTLAHLPADMKLLKSLSVLDVASNNLTVLPSDLLTSTTLTVLNVSDNNLNLLSFNITQLKHLRVLEMSNNRIGTQNFSDISKLENLEKLTLSANWIQNIPKEMASLNKLKVLELDSNYGLEQFNYFNEVEPYISLEVLKLSNTGFLMDEGVDILEKLHHLKYIDLSRNNRFTWADKPFRFLQGKQNLTFLNMSGIDMNTTGLFGSRIREANNFDPLSNLKVLDVSHCKLNVLEISIFTKLQSVENLNLSYNNLKTIPSNLSLILKYIKTIHLSNNHLVSGISLQLTPNSKLEFLDLSYNKITSPENIISSGIIKRLDLSSNNISKWDNPNIFSEPTNWVQHITFSDNSINFLTENMRQSLEALRSVDLGHNPTDCQNCEFKDMQNWLLHNGKVIVKDLTCHWPMDDVGKNVAVVKPDLTHCPSPTQSKSPNLIGTILIIAVGIVIFLIIGTTLCWYRLQIAYILHMFGVRRRCKEECDNCLEKEYDAFVCYSGLDSTWVCNELSPQLEREPENFKLCIHERDFPVGTFIMRNIDKAIKSSRHTIVVLSNRFLVSAWCRWELELTNYTMFDEDRDLIIMIQLEHLDQRKIPRYLQFLMNTRTYLEWPAFNSSNQASRDVAWRRLKAALGDSIYQRNKEAI